MPEDKTKRNKRMNDWKKEHKDRINILFEKGTKYRIKKAAEDMEISQSEFVRQAINEKLERCDKTDKES